MKKTELNALFHFNEADVEANSTGQLTPHQEVRIAGEEAKKTLMVGMLLAVVMAAISFVAHLSLRTWLILNLLVLAGSVAYMVMALWEYGILKIGNKLPRVEHTMGRIDLRIKKSSSSHNTLTVEGAPGIQLKINDDQLLALRRGEHYQVYYMPVLDKVLAIEPYLPDEVNDLDSDNAAININALAEKSKRQEFVLGDDGEVITSDETQGQQAKRRN